MYISLKSEEAIYFMYIIISYIYIYIPAYVSDIWYETILAKLLLYW